MTILNAGTRRHTTSAANAPVTTRWQQHGVCRDEDPDLFFPTGGPGEVRKQNGAAQQVCFRCPVMEQCLNWALETGQDMGVWGGLSAEDRRRLRRGQPRIANSVVVELGSREPDLAVVDAYLKGEVADISDVDRLAAIAAGVERGMTYKGIDALHGLGKHATSSFVRRIRKSFEATGVGFPWPEVRASSHRMLTDEQVEAIRGRAASGGVTFKELAAEYEVHRSTISSLVTGESYPNVGGPIQPKTRRRQSVTVVELPVQSDMGVAA